MRRTSHPTLGRHFIANSDIPRGQEITFTKSASSISSIPTRCNICFNSCSIPCSICNTSYCSNSCLLSHQSECIYTSNLSLSDYNSDICRLMIRLLNTVTETDKINEINELCSNVDRFTQTQTQEFVEITEILYKFIQPDLQKFNNWICTRNEIEHLVTTLLFDENEIKASLFLLICREECNSFGLYSFDIQGAKFRRQPYGLSLFPEIVYFNHSCKPNVYYIQRKDTMFFYAGENIKQGDALMISYLGHEIAKDRKQFIKDVFFFDCQCDACLKNEVGELGYCGTDGCYGWPVPPQYGDDKEERWFCEACRALL